MKNTQNLKGEPKTGRVQGLKNAGSHITASQQITGMSN